MIRRGPPDEYSYSIKDSFLIFEIVYFLILFLFFKVGGVGGGGKGTSPPLAQALYCSESV